MQSQILTELQKMCTFTMHSQPNPGEYVYQINFTSNTGTRYTSYDNWHAYTPTAPKAKEDIIKRLRPALILLISDIVLKDEHGNQYFTAN